MKTFIVFGAAAVVMSTFSVVGPAPDAVAVGSGRIAFAATGRASGIYTVRPDGTHLRRLTRGRDRNPTWSPDGTMIAFVRPDGVRDYKHSLMVMDADGTNERKISTVATWRAQDFDWSPDSTHLVYGDHTVDDEDDLFVSEVATRDRQRLVDVADATWNPRWSPTGTEILFVSLDEATRTDVYTVEAPRESRGTVPTPPPSPTPVAQSTQYDDRAEWSPNGASIAFVSSRDHPVESGVAEQSNDIYVTNADGSETRRLSESVQQEAGLKWRPDGAVLAYVAFCLSHVCDTDQVLRARFVTGGDSWPLARNVGGVSLDWSPEGDRLVYVRNDGRDLDLMTVDWLGRQRKVLVGKRGNQLDPDWR